MPVIPSRKSFLLLLLLLLPCMGASALDRLRVDGPRIVDESGRTVYLRGVNLGEKSQSAKHVPWQQAEDYHNLGRWGMNAVRMLIFWSAVEPEPGKYDEDYLKGVDRQVAMARDAGLYVMLDMHQDLYGPGIPGGDGAPSWATLDDGKPHRTMGGAWSTAYYASPKLHRAFDNFWDNTPGPDGAGIQDHFALAWAHVARRYANEPAVIGFDILNEPFMGSSVRKVGVEVWKAIPEIFKGAEAMPRTLSELINSLGGHPLPAWAMRAFEDPARYRRMLAAIEPVTRAFETEKLQPMYQRVRDAIRRTRPDGIIFIEANLFANTGVPSALEPLGDGAGGRESQQAYAPHFYDIVVDSEHTCTPSPARLDVMIEARAAEAARLGMPSFIGEWGAFYGSEECRNAANLSAERMARHTFGEFYWEYHRGLEKAAYFDALRRVSPEVVAGTPLAAELRQDAGEYTLTWREDPAVTTPTRIYLPPAWAAASVSLEPAANGHTIEALPNPEDGAYCVIPPSGGNAPRTVTLKRRGEQVFTKE